LKSVITNEEFFRLLAIDSNDTNEVLFERQVRIENFSRIEISFCFAFQDFQRNESTCQSNENCFE